MKRELILFCLACMIPILSGCTGIPKAQDRDLEAAIVKEQEEPEELVHPPVTSNEVQLYVDKDEDGIDRVVNAYGTVAADYSVDQRENIVSDDGTIVVSSENTIRFKTIQSLKFSEESYNISLDPLNLPIEYYYSGQYMQYSVPFKIYLSVSEADATNQIILLESSNPEVAFVSANLNSELVADGKYNVESGCLAIQPVKPNESISIIVTAKMTGDATITARSLSGYASAQCEVHVEFGEGDKTGIKESWLNSAVYSTADHVHCFTQSVTVPTIWEEGFTEYTCEECGYSYRGNYISRLNATESGDDKQAHVHQYTASTVAPTETERGYTLYVCQECGDSYKANYVDPISK